MTTFTYVYGEDIFIFWLNVIYIVHSNIHKAFGHLTINKYERYVHF